MGTIVMVSWMTVGSLLGSTEAQVAAAKVAPPPASSRAVVLEVKVYDPELAEMARDLEREVFPLLPPGAALVR